MEKQDYVVPDELRREAERIQRRVPFVIDFGKVYAPDFIKFYKCMIEGRSYWGEDGRQYSDKENVRLVRGKIFEKIRQLRGHDTLLGKVRERVTGVKGTFTGIIDRISPNREGAYARSLRKDPRFKEIIFGLARAERLIIILRYHEDMSYGEIGAVFDIPEERIERMHHGILQRMKRQLEEGKKREKSAE